MIAALAALFIAFFAVESLSQMCSPSVFSDHPRTQLPWRPMPHVLRVATGQLCDPIAVLILMKSDDRLLRHSYHRNGAGAAYGAVNNVAAALAGSSTNAIYPFESNFFPVDAPDM
jgi:hypothetical protein